jgi:hypothetical protein
MIEIELPCCGIATALPELTDEIRCDDCGVLVEVAADSAADSSGASSRMTFASALAA